MTVWFTSDLHFGHRFVAKLRGFKDADGEADLKAHTDAIERAWSAVVKPDDIVWVLGDICISTSTWDLALFILGGLPGRKRLINGNHDPISSIHRDGWKFHPAARKVFEAVQDFAKIRLGGRTVLLSHYPYSGVGAEGLRNEDGSQVEERYGEFRLPDYGYPLLHGHTHGPEKLHFSDGGTRQIHVGLDAWNMKLVSQHEVERLLDNGHVAGVNVEA